MAKWEKIGEQVFARHRAEQTFEDADPGHARELKIALLKAQHADLIQKAFDICLEGRPSLLIHVLRKHPEFFDGNEVADGLERAAERAAKAKAGGTPVDAYPWLSAMLARRLYREWQQANKDAGIKRAKDQSGKMLQRCCEVAVEVLNVPCSPEKVFSCARRRDRMPESVVDVGFAAIWREFKPKP